MRYRQLDVDGDYVIGGAQAFLVDTPEAVAQAVKTRLNLIRGEWFVDTSAGMPWQDVVGKNTRGTADIEIRQCILGTQGVTEISGYSSTLDVEARRMHVEATLKTIYGSIAFDATL